MYLINEYYLVRDLHIPDMHTNLDVPGNEDIVESYLDKYPRLLLQKALGVVLFEEFNSFMNGQNLVDDAPEVWKKLVKGVTYEYNNKTFRWNGLLYEDGTFKVSVLAHFAFLNWYDNTRTRTSVMGESVGKSINATSVNGTEKSVRIWNEFIEMYQGGFQGKCFQTMSYYKGIPLHHCCGYQEDDYVSLLTFLDHKKEDYPNAKKFRFSPRNNLGL